MARAEDERAARLADALRANLKRRKQQARAQAGEPAGPAPPLTLPAEPSGG